MRYFATLLLVGLLVGCAGEPSSDSGSEDSTTETSSDDPSAGGEEAMDDLFIVDVRSQSEWDDGHLDQAVHIPHTEIGKRISEVTEDKDAKIIVYCAVGGRAGKAKKALEEMGFTNIENGGGLKDMQGRFESSD